MKTLSVYSNGQWVEVGGSGAADLSQYATIEYVDGKVDAVAGVIEHDAELPQVSPASTPLQIIQAWAGYEPGLHLFKGGPQRNMVLLSKASFTGTTNTAEGEKPTSSDSMTATVFVNGTGSTYIKIITTTIDGVQATARSEILASIGSQWAKMESLKGDVPFGAPQVADIFGAPIAPDLTGLATQAAVDLKADKADTYTKVEVDGKFSAFNAEAIVAVIAGSDIEPSNVRTQTLYFDSVAVAGRDGRIVTANESGKMETVALLSDLDAVSPPDLTPYAKLQDNQQAILAKAVTAYAYGFGDSLLPSVGLGYLDTGEGYGARLILNIGLETEFLVYKSDLEPLNALLPRIESLESKTAPVVDLAPYVTLETADAIYGRKDALDLLRTQTQTIFDSVYTRVEADARYPLKTESYTKTECDGKFSLKTFEATVYTKTQADTLLNAKAATATTYTKTEVDTKLATAVTIGPWVGGVPGGGMTGSVASRKIGADIIQIEGNLSFGTIAANSWTDIALLQSTARPAKDANFTAIAMDGAGVPSIVSIWAYASGKVTMRNYGAITSLTLNAIVASR